MSAAPAVMLVGLALGFVVGIAGAAWHLTKVHRWRACDFCGNQSFGGILFVCEKCKQRVRKDLKQ